MTELADLIIHAYMEPDPRPFMFIEGQKVTVKKKTLEDGQTPSFWVEEVCEIKRRYCTGIFKDHWYVLKHKNGAEDHFREYELDARYSRCERGS